MRFTGLWGVLPRSPLTRMTLYDNRPVILRTEQEALALLCKIITRRYVRFKTSIYSGYGSRRCVKRNRKSIMTLPAGAIVR